MTRVSTLGANTSYIQRVFDIQNRLNTEQTQVSTGLKSQIYSGISEQTNILINFQDEKDMANQFIASNSIVNTRLSAASTAATAVQTTVANFRNELVSFYSGNTSDQQNIKQVQTDAFNAMVDIQSSLATNVDGQYLFSGGRVSTQPVQLPASTLTDFQALFDGSNTTYPTTRTANLLDTHLTNLDTTALSFDLPSGTVTAANATGLTNIPSGSSFTVSNSLSNNQAFVVRNHALTNVGGTALAETNGLGSGSPTITYGSAATPVLPAATGDLNFSFMANGDMKLTPTTAGSLSSLTVGTAFTISGSTGAAWDGAYKVVSNTNGVVEIATNTDLTKTETANSTAMTVQLGGVAQTITPAGPLTFSVASASPGGTTVTLSGANFTALGFNAAGGDALTLGGSQFHNGTFTTTAATATSVSFKINPDALRVSKFMPQINRTDVTLSYPTGPVNSNVSPVPTTAIAPPNIGALTFTPGAGVGLERITSAIASNGTVGTTVTADGASAGDNVHFLTSLSNKATGAPLGIMPGDSLTLSGTGVTATYTVTTASTLSDIQNFVSSQNIGGVTFSSAIDSSGHFAITTSGGASPANDITIGGTNLATKLGLAAGIQAAGGVGGTTIGTVALGSGAFGTSPNFTPAVGTVFSLKSTSGVNDGAYTVVANDGTNIDIKSVPIATEAGSTTAKIDASSWYKGDNLTIQQQVDKDRTLDVGINAADPGFEKAIRAMGMIAQGAFGTAGGLDQNQSRIHNAIYLLNDALDTPTPGPAPFGTEVSGNITSVQQKIGVAQSVIKYKNDLHTQTIGFLDSRISDITVMDKTEAVTALMTDSNALQASYQALAKVQSLSLLNFLK
jgi:flagellin-like hook-associated protein FlgL